MRLLQFSSAQGPEECCLAVAKALDFFIADAEQSNITVTLVESELGRYSGTFRSVLLAIEGIALDQFLENWLGTIQWICVSPYRPNHGRKNWFFGVKCFDAIPSIAESEIRFETCRASGPGGQHVNKTDSAVRATHVASGISVKVQSCRSQHANKRLALQLIAYKQNEMYQQSFASQRAERRMFHHQIERGSPVKIFNGMSFNLLKK